jgi:hypothetical protein
METHISSSKIVVFDLDETLGYFMELGIFWDSLKSYQKQKKQTTHFTQNDFNEIIELYPEFIRPNIFSILKYLKRKSESGKCDGVMIYTNNNGPKEWVNHIKDFFQKKINYPLFIHVISAFKVQGKQIEMCRTSYDKTMKDFINCTKIPKNTQICYLDDVFYPNMNHDNVYYIKVKPYIHDLTFEVMIHRFLKSEIGKSMVKENEHEDFSNYMHTNLSRFDYSYVEKTKKEYDIDKIITKKTMIYLQDFFSEKYAKSNHQKIGSTLTRRHMTKKNKTLKNV